MSHRVSHARSSSQARRQPDPKPGTRRRHRSSGMTDGFGILDVTSTGSASPFEDKARDQAEVPVISIHETGPESEDRLASEVLEIASTVGHIPLIHDLMLKSFGLYERHVGQANLPARLPDADPATFAPFSSSLIAQFGTERALDLLAAFRMVLVKGRFDRTRMAGLALPQQQRAQRRPSGKTKSPRASQDRKQTPH